MQNVKNQCQDQTNNKAFNNPRNSELPHKILNINILSINNNMIKLQTHIFTRPITMIDDYNFSLLVSSNTRIWDIYYTHDSRSLNSN